ncbi:unnamed protein product [Mesocestoides corti]|uniref:MAT1 centre domain-containing protein n=1 Tax=Mesocestoides corti TaxID=53468 RepID=A0A0R3UNT6_MESCO|nr:unnamed protein product [Mesocestoides corti]
MGEYDNYLELIEDIIYKLVNDIDVDKTKKFVDKYKKDNMDTIKRNRTKQLSSVEFYDRELEHERMLRERREKAEAEDEAAEVLRRKRLLAAKTLQGFFSGGVVALPEEKQKPKLPESTSMEPPAPSSVLESKHRFLPPPTGSAALQRATPASFMPLPPTPASRWGGNPHTPSTGGLLTPVSSLVGIQQFQPSTWATSAEHHAVVIPPVRKRPQDGESEDTVVLNRARFPKPVGRVFSPNLSFCQASRSADTAALAPTRTLKEWLEPYKPELCGPQPPSPQTGDVRWPGLTSVYLTTVVEPLAAASAAASEPSLSHNSNPHEVVELSDSVEEATVEPRVGVSHALPRGACGISPDVFLARALQDSRCGLFI